MSFLAAVRVALAALMTNKARSALTSLGIVIGIGAVISLVSAGEGARETLDDRLDSIGKSIILVRPGARTQQGTVADIVPLAHDDAAVIRKRVGHLLVGTSELQMAQRVVSSRFAHWNTVLVGGTPELQPIRKWKIEQGRFYNDDDMKKMAPVCLLGSTTKQKLFPDRADVVGQTIRVDHLRLRVIGVTVEKGRSPTGADQDDLIFVPITTLQRKLVGDDHISLILCAARSENEIDTARDEIDRVLRERRRLKAGQSNDFDVSSVREMSELAVILTATLQLLTAVIASISLLVGGIGIMNIMLVSVTERTREIGVRMAIGATGYDVLMQFLIEAVVLSLVGGVVGVSLGVAAAVALAWAVGWPVVIVPESVLLAFAVSAGVGVFFGYYPALKASRLDPIEALRYE